MSSSADEKNDRQARVMLWALPRSGSSAFLRAMTNANRAKCIMEPYTASYELGTERVSTRYLSAPPRPGLTFRNIKDVLQKPYPGMSLVFSKCCAFAMRGKLDSPDYLPENYIHTFIIRQPRQVITSLYKLWVLEKSIQYWDYIDIDEIGFETQFELFQLVTQVLGQKAIVVEQNDLYQHPESVLRQYCALTGIAYAPEMVQWRHPAHDMEPFEGWESRWFEDVLQSESFHSSHFNSKLPASQQSDQFKLPQYVEKMITTSQPYYDALYPHRILPEVSS